MRIVSHLATLEVIISLTPPLMARLAISDPGTT